MTSPPAPPAGLPANLTADPAAPPWADCIRAVAERQDRAAFALLFAHFAPRIKTLMLRSGVDAPAAEELAHDALLVVWRKAALFNPGAAGAATWIFTIARNLCIDGIRRGRSRKAADLAADLLPDPARDLNTTLMTAEIETRLRGAVSSLPARQWQVVEMSFFQDRTHDDIAADLGIPLGTVKSRLRLAVARLRNLLGDLA